MNNENKPVCYVESRDYNNIIAGGTHAISTSSSKMGTHERQRIKQERITHPRKRTYCPVKLSTFPLLCSRTNWGRIATASKYIEKAQNTYNGFNFTALACCTAILTINTQPHCCKYYFRIQLGVKANVCSHVGIAK